MHLLERLEESFDLFDDVGSLTESELRMKLSVPSNTIWDQLWCVVGARESYARALESGNWEGFTCSLTADDRGQKQALQRALASSRSVAAQAVEGDSTSSFALDLLLHETQHQGQIIRYLLGLGIDVPAGWASRWGV